MSMDFGFDMISDQEYERQRALYGPLTEALDSVRDAQDRIEALTQLLESKQRAGVKTFARGYLKDANGPTVEAEGVFIRPAWARDAG